MVEEEEVYNYSPLSKAILSIGSTTDLDLLGRFRRLLGSTSRPIVDLGLDLDLVLPFEGIGLVVSASAFRVKVASLFTSLLVRSSTIEEPKPRSTLRISVGIPRGNTRVR